MTPRWIVLLLVLAAAACGRDPGPQPSSDDANTADDADKECRNESWIQLERVAILEAKKREGMSVRLKAIDDAITRLDDELQQHYEDDKGPWIMVLIGEWFLARFESSKDKEDRRIAGEYFKAVLEAKDSYGTLTRPQLKSLLDAARSGLDRVSG